MPALSKYASRLIVVTLTGSLLISCGSKTEPTNTDETIEPPTDEVIMSMQSYGYTCQNTLVVNDLENYPAAQYLEGKLHYLTLTDEDGITYVSPTQQKLRVSGFESPIFLSDGTMYSIETTTSGSVIIGPNKETIGTYSLVEYPDGTYPELFVSIQNEGATYQLVGETTYGPFQQIGKSGMSPLTGLFYLYAQKDDGKWYYIDKEGETEVSSKAYFQITSDGTDVMQMYYPDDTHPEKYIVIK